MVAINPNNWHWVDKNCYDWAKKYFKDNLVGLKAENDSVNVEIKSLKSLEGDVEVCQRKGKVISLFDLNLSLNFEGNKSKGVITIPEIAYDTEFDEFQFDLSFDKQDEESRILIRKDLVTKIRGKLSEFGNDLIRVHGSDIQVDEDQVESKLTKENQKNSLVKSVITEKTTFNKGNSTAPKVSKTSSNASIPKYNTTKLHLSPVFHTTAEQLYVTLLEPDRVAAWTRSPPQIKPEEGSDFQLFGGNIQGKILKLTPNKKIEMLWRLKDWKEGHYTKLTIDLIQGDSETKMNVDFDGIPIGDEELVENNFNSYYVRSIMLTFGFGAIL